MSYRVVKGDIRVIGGQPDGDSVRFRPDTPQFLTGFPQGDAKISGSGPTKDTTQLRFEGVDALELHYQGSHQEISAARRARDVLLHDIFGFTSVQLGANETAVSSNPPSIRGYIFTNGLDNPQNRRPVSFLFTGTIDLPDGSDHFVTPNDIASSCNSRLLDAGEAYPLYYDNLPAELRDSLTVIAVAARSAARGLYTSPGDESHNGINLANLADLEQHAIFPKLYRRLKDYFASGSNMPLSGFDAWVRETERRDDQVWISPLTEIGNLHDTYEVTAQTIKMLYGPEQLVFVSIG